MLVTDLLEEFQMSNIFNTADLRKYHPPTDNDMSHRGGMFLKRR